MPHANEERGVEERERERPDGRQKGPLRPRFGVWRLVKAAGVYSSTRCLVLIADAAALATCVECRRIARQGVIDVSEIELSARRWHVYSPLKHSQGLSRGIPQATACHFAQEPRPPTRAILGFGCANIA